MITYRDCTRELVTAEEIRQLRKLARDRDTEGLLVWAGEIEQALLDAARPTADGWDTLEQCCRALVLAAGRAYRADHAGLPVAPSLSQCEQAIEVLSGLPLPENVTVKAPEGYLHYALDPAAYLESAARYAATFGAREAARAVVIGIRSIGTSLSAVVAAALDTNRTFTVRPRGASGRRHIVADDRLQARLRTLKEATSDVLVVDEGPGATGETLRCVATWLEAEEVPSDRIVLFPSHTGGMALAPEERRRWFASARTFAPEPEKDRIERVAARLGLDVLEDLSEGRWRRVLPGARSLPACPHHERRKYMARDASGSHFLIRYAGLGRWGRETVARACRLAEAGIAPPVHGFKKGFLARSWIPGTPADHSSRSDPGFRNALHRYVAGRTGRLRTGARVNVSPLVAALLENACEALASEPPGLATAVDLLERLPEREAVIADARLQLHEWIQTKHGYAKVDALDHGDGVRLPGPTDVAWDLAGASIEFALDDAALAELIQHSARASGESTAALRSAVAAYRGPYAACRLGEATLCSWEASTTEDRERYAQLAGHYTDVLRDVLQRLPARNRLVTLKSRSCVEREQHPG